MEAVGDVSAGGPHHKTFDAFQIAIQDGCYMCIRVRESALGTDIEDWVVNGTAITEERGSFTSFLFKRFHRFLPDSGQPDEDHVETTVSFQIGDSWHDPTFLVYRHQGR